MRLFLFSLSTLILALATPALAVDGVLEINQTCAVQTGCFAGDTAGFPVTISAPGSYRLTGNLEVPDLNTSGIVSTLTGYANGTNLDLNGFSITRTSYGGCGGQEPFGSGSGVVHVDLVKNGTIAGMGLDGVEGAREVRDIVAYCNRRTGIRDASKVSGCRADGSFSGIESSGGGEFSQNIASGYVVAIQSGEGSIVTDNRVSSNNTPIIIGANSIITGNTVVGSGSGAFSIGANSIVSGNVVREGVGAFVGGGSQVTGNSLAGLLGSLSVGDGSRVSGNSGANIAAEDHSIISDNSSWSITVGSFSTVQRNNISGLLTLGDDSTYQGNTINSSGTTVSGTGVNMGDNYCSGTGAISPSCP